MVDREGCPLEALGGGEFWGFPAVFGVKFVGHVEVILYFASVRLIA